MSDKATMARQHHPGVLLIRARLADERLTREFDDWYAGEHLPLARSTLAATRAVRFWSTADPSVHYALYEFDDVASIVQKMGTPEFASLVAHFDRRWNGRVERVRDVLVTAQIIEGGAS